MANYNSTIATDIGPGFVLATISAAGDPAPAPTVTGLPSWATFNPATNEILIDTTGVTFVDQEQFVITITSDNGCPPAAVDTITLTAVVAVDPTPCAVTATGMPSPIVVDFAAGASNAFAFNVSMAEGECDSYTVEFLNSTMSAPLAWITAAQGATVNDVIATPNAAASGQAVDTSVNGFIRVTCNAGTCAGEFAIAPVAFEFVDTSIVECTPVTINAPVQVLAPECQVSSSPLDLLYTAGDSITYTLSAANGSCTSWQTWLVDNANPGPSGAGFVAGQVIGNPNPGQYSINTAGVAPGNYWVFAKCNDGGTCQDVTIATPVTVAEGIVPCETIQIVSAPNVVATEGTTATGIVTVAPAGFNANVAIDPVDSFAPLAAVQMQPEGDAAAFSIDTSGLPIGNYTYTVEATNSCSGVFGSFTLTVEAVANPCQMVSDLQPQTIAQGGSFTYQLSMFTGSCTSWQTWLVDNDTQETTGAGFVNGQSITQPGPGQYNINTAGVAPGNYWVFAKCNDGGTCQNATATKVPVTIT